MLVIKKPVGIMGVNCYILGDREEAIIVDPGSNAEAIVKTLEAEKICAKFIVLTHCHFDHIMAVNDLVKETGVKVIACCTEKENLLSPAFNYTDKYSRKPISIAADIYVSDGEVIKSGKYTFKVIETPGHTSGGMCIYCEEEKIIVTGDTLFYSSIGRYDLATGDEQTLINSIKSKLLVLPDDVSVLPGHGDTTTIGFERFNNPFIC